MITFRGQIKVKNSLERVKFFIQFGKWQEKTLKINVFKRFCKKPIISDHCGTVNETKPAAKVGKKSNILKSWRARYQLETNYASFWQAALTSSRHTLLQLHSTYIAASIWTTFKVIRLSSVLNFGPLDVTLLTNYLSKAYWFPVFSW